MTGAGSASVVLIVLFAQDFCKTRFSDFTGWIYKKCLPITLPGFGQQSLEYGLKFSELSAAEENGDKKRQWKEEY